MRFKSEEGRKLFKISASIFFRSMPRSYAICSRNTNAPSERVGPGSTAFTGDAGTRNGLGEAAAPKLLLSIEPFEARLEIGLQILNVFEPGMDPERRSCRLPCRRRPVLARIERQDQALEAAPTIPHAE